MLKHIGVVALQTVLLAEVASADTLAQAAGAGWNEAEHQWQLRLLFEPRESQRQREQRGRIVIYSDLTDTVVDKAMDDQFERIENMMFVRTVSTDADGKVKRVRNEAGELVAVVDEDGC